MPKLFPYQEDGVNWLEQKSTALLADQPGLGKTAQAIMAARVAFSPFGIFPRICVVCPKSAIENWRREFAIWWPEQPLSTTMIVNYDRLSIEGDNARKVFLATNWDLLIADEAHRLKSSGAKRSQTFYRKYLTQKPHPRVWLLTGTPSRNHAGELWTHLRTLRPDLIRTRGGTPMSEDQFQDRYCNVSTNPYGHRTIHGSKNRKELRDLLVDGGFLLRRMKKSVQAQLPDLIMDTYPLQIAPGAAPNTVLQVLGEELQSIKHQTDDGIIHALQQEALPLSTERRMLGMLKAEPAAELIEDELDAPGQKIIAFFHHRDVGEKLLVALGKFNPAVVHGGTNDAQAQVDRFQNDASCRVFLGQITACGEALNITAATQVYFVEASWSPADNYQAACRAHRIGLGHNLIVRFLSVAGSLDDTIQKVLARKTMELAELFD